MNEKKPTVTLEDLLRIKRAERPPAEFWDRFDRELRLKELAAIVEPRPWWASFIRVGARISRYQLPIGAAAILALSFVTVREYRTSDYAPSDLAVPTASESVTAVSEAAPTETVADAAPRSSTVSVAPAMAVVPVANVGEHSHTAPLQSQMPTLSDEPSPSARAIAANLAVVQATDPRLVENVFAANVRTVEMRRPVSDPLTHMRVGMLADSRSARLLTTALPLAANARATTLDSNDRLVRHLTEDQLYDRVSRIDGDANRLVIKF